MASRVHRADSLGMDASVDHAEPRPIAMGRAGSDRGFTIIEVVVAATLLVLGSLATLALIDSGAQATTKSVQNDRANAVANELIERVAGLRYTKQNNDLTDVNGTVGPGARLAAATSPDVSPPPAVTVSGAPGHQVSTWTMQRGASTFDVSYTSCTRSDRISQVVIQGPYDCGLPTVPPTTGPTSPTAPCEIQLANRSQLDSQFAARVPSPDITIRLQLLNTLGAQACLQGTLDAVGVGKLLAPACQTLGTGGNALNTVNGLLGGVFQKATGLGAKIALSVCPRPDGTPFDPVNPGGGVAATTQVEVTVSWYATGKPQTAANRRTIVQSSVVRRPGA